MKSGLTRPHPPVPYVIAEIIYLSREGKTFPCLHLIVFIKVLNHLRNGISHLPGEYQMA
jgi:hypothetical protein